jgi:hypothetical protein
MNDDLEGMTILECPKACTKESCVISTVGSCKHPFKSGDDGCGPVTMYNRARARLFLGAIKKDTAA